MTNTIIIHRTSLPARTGLFFILLGSLSTLPASAQTVQKLLEPFNSPTWRIGDDSSAGGSIKISQNVPTELGAASKGAVDFQATFSGTGFEFLRVAPPQPLVIPGITKKISLWTKADPNYGWVLQFKDGWGRTEVGGKLEWNITNGADGTWKKMTFDVPDNWVQPISLDAVQVHNWGRQAEKGGSTLSVDQLEVETDISNVDPETGILKSWKPSGTPENPAQPSTALAAPVTPLLNVSLSGAQLHNVFSGEKTQFLLTAQNWNQAPISGNMQWKVSDAEGKAVKEGTQVIKVEDNLTLNLPLDVSKYSVYKFDSTITWANGKKTTSSQPFAVIPVAHELSDAEKDASPYGLNVLSARQPMVSTFRKAGIIWYRDYGFDYEWMLRAKGADKSYSGWPWYPKIVKQYEDSGVRVLANLKSAIKPPGTNGQNAPGLTWTREMMGIMTAFPSLRAFELDNEYDLNGENAKAEDAIGWSNYASYHKKFGELANLLSDGKFLAVENGRAGIWPERVRRVVKSGAFAPIDVINSHHYAGIDPPETNVINHNMGFSGGENVMTFFDQLRAVKSAAASDGKARQHWLTEFGWDTKAGPVVTPLQQAAYLARGFMMLTAAGTDKGFWYWDLDSPVANQFFDGCGLFTYDQMPKLSYAAYAGLTQILPKPEYIGMINAGENTWGYLFRNEGKLVAALWTLNGEKGPLVKFENAVVYDYLANSLGKNSATLGITPVYAVGVSEDSRWFRQAAYNLETPLLSLATAGDSLTSKVLIKNSGKVAINSKLKLQLPAGWNDASGEQTVSIAPGQSKEISLTFRIATKEVLGEKTIGIAISEGELLKTIPLRVQIGRPVSMTVRALKGEPGNSDVSIRISNRSAVNLDGTISLKLPTSWKTSTPEIKIEALKPMEVRDVQAKVQWAPTWKDGESAIVEYKSADGRTAQQPLIPSRLTVYSAPNLVIDGDLKDWPSKNKLPAWALGSTQGDANASIYMAWSAKGLHLALDVHDSKAIVPDPKSFWVGDVLELFLDTHNKKTARKFEAGDHQFWFAPLVAQKRVYAGRWKRNEEIAETKYDFLSATQSAVVKTADGYILETLLPASAIQDFKAVVGTQLGMNLNLSVKGLTSDREVYWAIPKSEGAEQPGEWGNITLEK